VTPSRQLPDAIEAVVNRKKFLPTPAQLGDLTLMHKPSFATSVAVVALLVLTAACGSDSSTGPKGPTAAQAAMHFDTLETLAAGHSWGDRVQVLTLLELAAASGATPSPVSVNVGGTTQTWSALTISIVQSSGGSVTDSENVTIAYSDYANVTNAVIGEFEINVGGPTTTTGIVLGDTILATATTATFTASVASTGSACSALPSGLMNTQIASIRAQFASCSGIKLQSAFSGTFPATTGLDPSLQSISFNASTANGIRVTE
jgi:hypothetical protein